MTSEANRGFHLGRVRLQTKERDCPYEKSAEKGPDGNLRQQTDELVAKKPRYKADCQSSQRSRNGAQEVRDDYREDE